MIVLVLIELFGRSFIIERFSFVLLSCCTIATDHESISRLRYLTNSLLLPFGFYHRKSLVKLTSELG
ncbi:MAG: hypothetical protein ACTS44_01090 [Candidatus Hodgkinia cicadicola]